MAATKVVVKAAWWVVCWVRVRVDSMAVVKVACVVG